MSVVNLDNDGAEGTMHVFAITGNSSMQGKKWWKATITIQVHDANEAPVADATVTGAWANGITGTASCTTDAAGRCTVNANKIINTVSSVTFTVTNISHTTLTYNHVFEKTVSHP